jgi:hypothetical protein
MYTGLRTQELRAMTCGRVVQTSQHEKTMKTMLCIGAAAIALVASAVYAQATSDEPTSNIHGWRPPSDDSHHGWGAPRPGDPETGRMTEHGWVAPRDKDCSLNHVAIEGSAQVRCMK